MSKVTQKELETAMRQKLYSAADEFVINQKSVDNGGLTPAARSRVNMLMFDSLMVSINKFSDNKSRLRIQEIRKNTGFLRQWLNEKDKEKVITDADIFYWLFGRVS